MDKTPVTEQLEQLRDLQTESIFKLNYLRYNRFCQNLDDVEESD